MTFRGASSRARFLRYGRFCGLRDRRCLLRLLFFPLRLSGLGVNFQWFLPELYRRSRTLRDFPCTPLEFSSAASRENSMGIFETHLNSCDSTTYFFPNWPAICTPSRSQSVKARSNQTQSNLTTRCLMKGKRVTAILSLLLASALLPLAAVASPRAARGVRPCDRACPSTPFTARTDRGPGRRRRTARPGRRPPGGRRSAPACRRT